MAAVCGRIGVCRSVRGILVAPQPRQGAVEANPITTTAVIAEELHVGTVPTFAAAGLVEVSHPTARRLVMRRDAE